MNNPRLKPIYPRYRLSKTLFRVGAQRGLTASFEDPNGQIWELAELLDGSRSVAEVVAEMTTRHKELGAEEVWECIEALDKEGFLGDPGPSKFDDNYNFFRYQGNVNHFSHYERLEDPRGQRQAQLLNLRVALLGLGGGGAGVLQLLGAIGVGFIRAVDKDIVEETNLNRQLIFQESDVGRTKTDAARDALSRQNSAIPTEFVRAELLTVEDVRRTIADVDIVICAIDEPRLLIHRIVNRACMELSVPCVYGAYQVSRGRVFSVIPGTGGCFDCLHVHYMKIDPNFVTQFHAIRTSGFRPPPLAYAPNALQLVAQMTDELVRIATNYQAPRSISTQIEIDFDSHSSSELLSWPRYLDDCPTCGMGSELAFSRSLQVPPISKS